MTTSPEKRKHVPQRTCIACRAVKAKRELVRLVRTPDNGVELDITGKKAGRGVYLCRTPECWEAGLKEGRLEHNLRIVINPENREKLIRLGREICRKDNRD